MGQSKQPGPGNSLRFPSQENPRPKIREGSSTAATMGAPSRATGRDVPARSISTLPPSKIPRRLKRSHKITTSNRNPSSTSSKGFRFLDLPGELRNKIYKYALTAPNRAIRLAINPARLRTESERWGIWERGSRRYNLALGLIATSRLVCHEARAILFQENTVVVLAHEIGYTSPRTSSDALSYVFSNARYFHKTIFPQVRHLFVLHTLCDLDSEDAYPEVNLRSSFPQLTSATITVIPRASNDIYLQPVITFVNMMHNIPRHVKVSYATRQTGVEGDLDALEVNTIYRYTVHGNFFWWTGMGRNSLILDEHIGEAAIELEEDLMRDGSNGYTDADMLLDRILRRLRPGRYR